MGEKIKWHRPKNERDFRIDGATKDILSFSVLFSCSKYAAVEKLCPEYLDYGGRLSDNGKQYADQLFGHSENKRYIKAMKDTLASISHGTYQSDDEEDSAKVDLSDKRKDQALKSLLDQAINLVEGGTKLDPDTLKTVSDIFKKIGLLKDETEVIEPPRRYLPELCHRGCRYRLFMESAIKDGQIEDECQYCRALKFANDNGYKDDVTNRLDIPYTTEQS